MPRSARGLLQVQDLLCTSKCYISVKKSIRGTHKIRKRPLLTIFLDRSPMVLHM